MSPVPLGVGKENASGFLWADVSGAKGRAVALSRDGGGNDGSEPVGGQAIEERAEAHFAAETTSELQVDGFGTDDRTSNRKWQTGHTLYLRSP